MEKSSSQVALEVLITQDIRKSIGKFPPAKFWSLIKRCNASYKRLSAWTVMREKIDCLKTRVFKIIQMWSLLVKINIRGFKKSRSLTISRMILKSYKMLRRKFTKMSSWTPNLFRRTLQIKNVQKSVIFNRWMNKLSNYKMSHINKITPYHHATNL